MKIIHIITGLGNGGAEGMLYRLCHEHSKYQLLNTHVINLSENKWYESKLKKIGVKVHKIYFKKKITDIALFIKLIKLLINLKPDVIQTWMYHANLVGGVFGYIFTNAKIFWNIRHTNVSIKYSKKLTIIIVRILSFLSHLIPNKIIYCSQKSKKVHELKFFNKDKSIFIPNGYDNAFYPSEKKRNIFRKEKNITKKIFVIGLAARFHEEKNFKNLINSFKLFLKNKNDVYLYLKGKNVTIKNIYFKNYLTNISKKNYKLDGSSSNILNFMNGIDLFVLPSYSESFPNVLAEAMLCETPCLSTNVGSAKDILKDFKNSIVPVNDSFALSNSIEKKYKIFKNKKKWNFLKKKSRKKIINRYNIQDIGLKYFKLWKKSKLI